MSDLAGLNSRIEQLERVIQSFQDRERQLDALPISENVGEDFTDDRLENINRRLAAVEQAVTQQEDQSRIVDAVVVD